MNRIPALFLIIVANASSVFSEEVPTDIQNKITTSIQQLAKEKRLQIIDLKFGVILDPKSDNVPAIVKQNAMSQVYPVRFHCKGYGRLVHPEPGFAAIVPGTFEDTAYFFLDAFGELREVDLATITDTPDRAKVGQQVTLGML